MIHMWPMWTDRYEILVSASLRFSFRQCLHIRCVAQSATFCLYTNSSVWIFGLIILNANFGHSDERSHEPEITEYCSSSTYTWWVHSYWSERNCSAYFSLVRVLLCLTCPPKYQITTRCLFIFPCFVIPLPFASKRGMGSMWDRIPNTALQVEIEISRNNLFQKNLFDVQQVLQFVDRILIESAMATAAIFPPTVK